MAAQAEIELKLETDSRGAQALRRHPLLKGLRVRTVEQAATYFDDAKGTLRKAGVSLRVRSGGGGFVQTVKRQDGGGAGLFARPEWERSVEGPELDRRALDDTPVVDLINGKPLRPIVAVKAKRSIWDLESIELVLDEGIVSGGDAEEPIAEIEIELKGGERAALFGMGRRLAEAAPLRLSVLSKVERGQRLADGSAAKPAKAERLRLSPDMTVAEGFAAIAYSCLRQFRLNEPVIARSRDPGALHQARVAMRRLRSAFSLFRPVIDDAEYQRLRGELRWFTSQLGEARNFDVMLKRLDSIDGPGVRPLAALLASARDAAYAEMLAAFGSERLRLLMFDIVAWLETGAWRHRGRAGKRLGDFASRALGKRWAKVEGRIAALAGDDAEARHQLRIEVKKLRYATEFLASLAADKKAQARQKKFVAVLEAMQEELGELNDCATARHTLESLLAGRRRNRALREAADRLAGSGETSAVSLHAAEKAAARLAAAGPYWL